MPAGPTITSLFEEAGLNDVPDFVSAFAHTPGTKVAFGCGALATLPSHIQAIGAKCALIVTDKGISKAGHVQRATEILSDNGIEAAVFDRVIQNPTTDCVSVCAQTASETGADLLIGLGGGSSMDTAKGCNFILTNGGRMQDYWGHDKATEPMLPMIAIPTTSGTGSECQSYALISDAKTHAKMACGDPKAAARVAILDPELTVSQPKLVTAHTGIDAIAHALETAVCNKRTETSLAYSHAAYRLLSPAFPQVLDHPEDLNARSSMLVGASLAGTAIENSMLGAAHSAANPLTAKFDVVHGEAVGIMLPHVVRFNASNPEIAKAYVGLTGAPDLESLCSHLTALLEKCGMPTRLRHYGITGDDVAQLAEQASKQWTAQFNPVALEANSFSSLYNCAL